MQVKADKGQENQKKAAANEHSQSAATFGFVDNRPEAVQLRKLQETADNSPIEADRLQALTDNSSRMLAQRRQVGRLFGGAAGESRLNAQAAPVQWQGNLLDEGLLQSRFGASEAPSPLHSKSGQRKNNTRLPDQPKGGIENLSGMSTNDARVHFNSDKPARPQALAYTQGTNIHVDPGQEKHLPHDAWHVVQQSQGRVRPGVQEKGVSIDDDEELESEADVMGAHAVDMRAQALRLKEPELEVVQRREKPVIQRGAGASRSARYEATEPEGTVETPTDTAGAAEETKESVTAKRNRFLRDLYETHGRHWRVKRPPSEQELVRDNIKTGELPNLLYKKNWQPYHRILTGDMRDDENIGRIWAWGSVSLETHNNEIERDLESGAAAGAGSGTTGTPVSAASETGGELTEEESLREQAAQTFLDELEAVMLDHVIDLDVASASAAGAHATAPGAGVDTKLTGLAEAFMAFATAAPGMDIFATLADAAEHCRTLKQNAEDLKGEAEKREANLVAIGTTLVSMAETTLKILAVAGALATPAPVITSLVVMGTVGRLYSVRENIKKARDEDVRKNRQEIYNGCNNPESRRALLTYWVQNPEVVSDAIFQLMKDTPLALGPEMGEWMEGGGTAIEPDLQEAYANAYIQLLEENKNPRDNSG